MNALPATLTACWQRLHADNQQHPLTLLQIDREQLWCLYADGGSKRQHALAIGYRQLGHGPLRQTPPSPFELERAIAVVEDQIMPLARWIAPGTLHVLCEPLALLRPSIGERKLSRDQIEHHFQRLAAYSEGDPLANGWPLPDNDGAAALLILREWLHHLDCLEVWLE